MKKKLNTNLCLKVWDYWVEPKQKKGAPKPICPAATSYGSTCRTSIGSSKLILFCRQSTPLNAHFCFLLDSRRLDQRGEEKRKQVWELQWQELQGLASPRLSLVDGIISSISSVSYINYSFKKAILLLQLILMRTFQSGITAIYCESGQS